MMSSCQRSLTMAPMLWSRPLMHQGELQMQISLLEAVAPTKVAQYLVTVGAEEHEVASSLLEVVASPGT